jgi:hypothetical protein
MIIALRHKITGHASLVGELKKSFPGIRATRKHDVTGLRILPDKDLILFKPKFGREAHGLTSPIAKNFGGTTHA